MHSLTVPTNFVAVLQAKAEKAVREAKEKGANIVLLQAC